MGVIFCYAASRRRAAQPRADKRLGRAPYKVRLSDVARSWQAAQGSLHHADQVIGCPFWFVFGQAKMNIYKNPWF